MHIDWIAKLRHLLQMIAFCLVIAAVHYAFRPYRPYEIPLIYSLAIGLLSWALIDFGRHLFPSSDATGWPAGMAGFALPVVGNLLGFVGGTWFADNWFGYSTWSDKGQLRVSLLIAVLSALALTYYFYARGKTAWLQTQVSEVLSQANDARLKLLETQLEPHMLFNTLANLRVLIGTDPARAQDMLDRMIAYLRATLTASRSTEHPLAQEFDRLRDYLELMAVRMGPRLAFTLELPDDLKDAPVPPLLLQPLVENAIRHGLEPKVEGGHILVRASQHPADASLPGTQRLVIEVTDTGVGLPPHLPEAGPGQSFGLAQARERLATLYGTEGTIDLIATDTGGTSAMVVFPLISSPRP
jgi:signal transduction histidine kinase